ncbi:sugar-binding transcriptional regulator [Paratissierella segnis]|uniref:Sugar-binding transcriptional regulator n=1 Tax=Paratissierella segnis TaxID=2763679 RepID=A0A926EWT8_9FIRM|nr:sugar-binding transcriptional regulator [Paratissierella segnis]MBC8587992.1 sugar-binding transcriptional regulator [Paratissierella segnis]
MLVDGRKRRLAEISYKYYIDNMSQNEIAKEYSISRSMVSTLLTEARESGIIKFIIEDADLYCFDLQKKLEEIFGIRKAIIVPKLSSNEDNLIYQLADGCIDYLYQIVEDNMTIAISWGRTLQAIANRIRTTGKQDLLITPMVGGIGNEMTKYHSNLVCELMAKNLGGNSYGLYAPVFVSTKEIKDIIFQDKGIRTVMETSKKADIAIVSIGNILSSVMRQIDILEEKEVKELLSKGAIGDMNTSFFDKDGNIVPTKLYERTISLTMDELNNIPTVVAVAGGEGKIEAIHGALKGKLMDVIVLDEGTAREILSNY